MGQHSSETVYFEKELDNPKLTPLLEEYSEYRLGFGEMQHAKLPENSPYSHIENGLNNAIIGQPEAIKSVLNALSREKLRNPARPIANILFHGPTSVGKSETAKELSRLLHPSGNAFTKIDCSSYRSAHQVNALIGAPLGYLGYGEKPVFDPDIIEQEKSVVLFDEIEKGSPELHDLMLQILDDGELRLPGIGRTVSFRNSIIIATTNLGASEMMSLLNPNKVGFFNEETDAPAASRGQLEAAALSALEKEFRPEFLNRFDCRVAFNTLDDANLDKALCHYAEDANDRYFFDAHVNLVLSEKLRHHLVTSSKNRRQSGVRPILRNYDQIVESKLAAYLSAGAIPEYSRVLAALGEEMDEGLGYEPHSIAFSYEPDEEMKKYYVGLEELREEEKHRILQALALEASSKVVVFKPKDVDFISPSGADNKI